MIDNTLSKLNTVLMVRTRALSATFHVGGHLVVAGEVYEVPVDIAEGLERIGKAQRVGWAE